MRTLLCLNGFEFVADRSQSGVERRASSSQVGAPIRVFRPKFMHDTFADLDEEIATLGGSSAARWGIVGDGRRDDQVGWR